MSLEKNRQNNATSCISLSATGSRIFPRSVIHPNFLARKPSITSVMPAATNINTAILSLSGRNTKTAANAIAIIIRAAESILGICFIFIFIFTTVILPFPKYYQVYWYRKTALLSMNFLLFRLKMFRGKRFQELHKVTL